MTSSVKREFYFASLQFYFGSSVYFCRFSEKDLFDQKLLRVSDHFRVVALALPVPQYVGYPLDPPLRSRFQGHFVSFFKPSTQLDMIRKSAPGVQVPW